MNYLEKNGLVYEGIKFEVKIRVGIFDIPAQSFFLCHKGHCSKKPCSRCLVKGVKYGKTMTFAGTDHPVRPNDSYVNLTDKDHHKAKSPLLQLGMLLGPQVPIDGMHAVDLGAHCKTLVALTTNKYGSKLPQEDIDAISERIEIVAVYCPREFARLPESLDYLKDFKGTQHRQFLLYFGVVVFSGILDDNTLLHYTLLSAAIRCLSLESPTPYHLKFAKLAINKYINTCDNVYDPNFKSYNIHCLQHIISDVEFLGSLDSYSAFPYENNMSFFRSFYKKPGQPVQQIYNRMKEREKHEISTTATLKSANHVRLFNPHNNGPFPSIFNNYQKGFVEIFKNVELQKFCLGINQRDNCCALKGPLSICIIQNIFKVSDSVLLLVKKFEIVEDLYNVGIPSSSFGVYKCSSLSTNFELIPIGDVKNKCYRMPYWKSRIESSTNNSSNRNEPVPDVFTVAELIHLFK